MTKGGNLKSTLIVTTDELRVNGGRWRLQSGPAIRVRGFNSDSIGDRRIIGGDALPIFILQESDARVNGGQFLLKGGQPIQVTDVIGSARGVIQGKAIPVWPVDDDGNFDSDFAVSEPTLPEIATLQLRLKADLITGLSDTDPIATWSDESGNGNDYIQGVAGRRPLLRTGIVNGRSVVRFDGGDDLLEGNLIWGLNSTLFGVVTPTAGTDDYLFASTGSGGGIPAIISKFGGLSYEWFNGGERETFSAGAAGFNILTIQRNDPVGTIIMRFNGVEVINQASVGAITANDLEFIAASAIGSNNAACDWAELLKYSSLISAANISLVETYLSEYYGISI